MFADEGVTPQDLHPLPFNSSDALNILRYHHGNLLMMSGFSDETQSYGTHHIYRLAEKRLISTNDVDQVQALLGMDEGNIAEENIAEDDPKFRVRNGQLFYRHQGREIALSDQLSLQETDANVAVDLEFRQPMLSPDGSKIAFMVVNAFGDLPHGPLCIADADGKNQRLLSRDGISQDNRPHWIGQRLVFLNSPLTDGNSQLRITDPVTNLATDLPGEADSFDVKPPASDPHPFIAN